MPKRHLIRFKRKITIIQILLLAKPIVDVFFSYSILDYVMMTMALFIFLGQCVTQKIKLESFDYIIAGMALLYTMTLFRNGISRESFITYVKVVSAYLLYYIGKNSRLDLDKSVKTLRAGYIIAFLINIFAILILQTGIQQWGNAQTLTGLFFFKTDFAVSLTGLIVFTCMHADLKMKDAILVGVALFMLLFTNARIAYLSIALIISLFVLYWREKKGAKQFQINIKAVTIFSVVSIGVLFGLRYLGQTRLFRQRGFISLSFNKLSDLLSASNTQGRNTIWLQLINAYSESSFFSKMFGVAIVTNIASLRGGAATVSSHSMYIAVLFAVGILGVTLFIAETLMILHKLNDTKNRKLFYVSLMWMVVFYVFGVTNNTNEFTEYTWVFMYFIGMLFNKNVYLHNAESIETIQNQNIVDTIHL